MQVQRLCSGNDSILCISHPNCQHLQTGAMRKAFQPQSKLVITPKTGFFWHCLPSSLSLSWGRRFQQQATTVYPCEQFKVLLTPVKSPVATASLSYHHRQDFHSSPGALPLKLAIIMEAGAQESENPNISAARHDGMPPWVAAAWNCIREQTFRRGLQSCIL